MVHGASPQRAHAQSPGPNSTSTQVSRTSTNLHPIRLQHPPADTSSCTFLPGKEGPSAHLRPNTQQAGQRWGGSPAEMTWPQEEAPPHLPTNQGCQAGHACPCFSCPDPCPREICWAPPCARDQATTLHLILSSRRTLQRRHCLSISQVGKPLVVSQVTAQQLGWATQCRGCEGVGSGGRLPGFG